MHQTLPFLAIAFPPVDPVLLSLGPLQIHWYGLGYIVGILFGWWYARRIARDGRLWGGVSPIREEDIDDFLVWAVAGIVLGGRLGYALFYDLPTYLENPLRIAMIWQGGMSFHGGLAGIIIAMLLFARRRGFSPFSLFDVIAASSGIGIFLVRVANFINQELFGRPTDMPFGVIFPVTGDGIPRHPSQLYEGLLEGLVLFAVLAFLIFRFGRLATPGFVGGAFLSGYAIARIMVEFVRLPDPQIGYLAFGWLTMGMVLSVPVLLVGLWGMASAGGRKPWRSGQKSSGAR